MPRSCVAIKKRPPAGFILGNCLKVNKYDVVIVGGGVSGTALFYELARYTDINRIAVLEKYSGIAPLNSHARANSQTIHCGDIETNYTLEKALKVKQAAGMVINYASRLPERDRLIRKYSKMVLAVGEKEVNYLKGRYEKFRVGYPHMELWDKQRIAEIEPAVAMVDGKFRKDEIIATGSLDQYCACDYAALSQSFVDQAVLQPGKTADVHLNTRVSGIKRIDDGFEISTNQGTFHASFVVFSAGAHSLLYAHEMGYGLNFSILPVAGSFYYTPKLLNGKVYTVQNDKLPFAAIHGDPDLLVDDKTRIGPTALILPMLERYNKKTVPEFFRTLKFDRNVAQVFIDFLKDTDIRNYIFKNILFDVPYVRTRLFLKDARKIIPSLDLADLSFAHGIGGVRPQMIDRAKQSLLLGEAKINPGDGIIFNMTPSPGGTSCLDNAAKDMRTICEFLGRHFDEGAFTRDLLADTPAAA